MGARVHCAGTRVAPADWSVLASACATVDMDTRGSVARAVRVVGKCWGAHGTTVWAHASRMPSNCINDERDEIRATCNWYPSYLRSATQLAPFPHHVFERRSRRGGKGEHPFSLPARSPTGFLVRLRANRSKLAGALYLTQTAADRAAVIPCAACAARRRRAACTSSTHSHVTFMPLARLSDD